MRRREFTTLLGAAAAWPFAARAQSNPVRRIGVLMNAAATEAVPQSYVAAFVQALRQLGWTEGQNVHIDIRWNAGDAQLARIYAAQLVGLMPDLIMAASTTNLAIPAGHQHHPGGVHAGLRSGRARLRCGARHEARQQPDRFRPASRFSIGGEWLDLLEELRLGSPYVGIVFNPDTSPQSKCFMRSVEAAAASFGVRRRWFPFAPLTKSNPPSSASRSSRTVG